MIVYGVMKLEKTRVQMNQRITESRKNKDMTPL